MELRRVLFDYLVRDQLNRLPFGNYDQPTKLARDSDLLQTLCDIQFQELMLQLLCHDFV